MCRFKRKPLYLALTSVIPVATLAAFTSANADVLVGNTVPEVHSSNAHRTADLARGALERLSLGYVRSCDSFSAGHAFAFQLVH